MRTIKKIFLLLSVVFLLGCNRSAQKTDLEMENLSGKVRAYQEFSYEALMVDGAVVKGARKREFPWSSDRRKEFNEAGFIVEDCHLESSEEITFCYKSVYDEENRKIESLGVDAAGNVKEKTLYQYNEKGQIIEYQAYFSDVLKGSGIYQYDKEGNLTLLLFYDEFEKLEIREELTYDKKGFLAERRLLNAENGVENCYIYKRDAKGNALEMNFFRKDMTPGGKYVFQYDKKDNLIEEHFYHPDGALLNKSIFQYQYDKQGNWIEKIVFKEKTATFIIERTMAYY